MFVLLPVVALGWLWGLAFIRLHTVRGALLMAVTVWCAALVLLTELLSLARALSLPGLLVSWLIVLVGLGVIAYPQDMIGAYRTMFARLRPATGVNLVVGLGLGVVAALTGLVALAAPPNTWDAMAYHLPRVFFWEQWQSIAPFPTHTIRQLYQPPLAEWLMLHLGILVGSDALANSGQWLALLGCGMGVSVITRDLGGSPRAQLSAAVLCMTLPMGIMQATGSKNDLLVGLWVVALTYFILRAQPPAKLPAALGNALFIGLAAGFAILTKGTAYVYILPLLVWYGLICLRQHGRAFWRPLAIAAGVLLLVNAGHFTRNMSVFGSPLTPPSHEIYYANDEISPRVFISNLLRNTALHLYIPDQLNRPINWRASAYNGIARIHEALGLDLNDPRTTFPWNEFEIPPIWQLFNEDRVGNPVHLLLFGAGFVIWFLIRRRLDPAMQRRLALLLLIGIAQFSLFSLLLKWQVWGTRLQLPAFIVITPYLALLYTTFWPRHLLTLLHLTLIGMAVFFAVNISTRPVFSSDSASPLAITRYVGSENIQYPSIFDQTRLDMYANGRSEWRAGVAAAAEALAALNCATIGLISDESGWLYPLMMRLQATYPALRLQHVNVTNESAALMQQTPYRDFVPCAIVSMYGAQPPLPAAPTLDGRDYTRYWAGTSYEIFVPAGTTAP